MFTATSLPKNTIALLMYSIACMRVIDRRLVVIVLSGGTKQRIAGGVIPPTLCLPHSAALYRGADLGTRTPNLLFTKQLLCQLS